MAKTMLSLCFAVFGSLVSLAQAPGVPSSIKTFCNPLDLPYNFQPDGPVRREAADPVIVLYQNKYWLFASKQIGYWWSDDMLVWHFVKPKGLPLDVYAPAVAVVDGKLIYFAGGDKGSFVTDDVMKGDWVQVSAFKRGSDDPALFPDDDGRLYLYDGCSDKTPLRVTELDARTFLPLTERVGVITANTPAHGWEVPGDSNTLYANAPWIEGSWMNKIRGKYYWQYAGPGTQFKTYGDGVYVSDKATGPFVYQPYSPFAFKPTGFMAGAGHSATFADKAGDYWHIGTGTISVRHMFERRLMLFPTGVLDDGQLVTNTYLGDYPQFAPGTAPDHLLGNLCGWMLLSYHKPAKASSTMGAGGVKNAFDEDVRTWWSATSGETGEWLQVDLGKKCRVNAIQINFADQGADAHTALVLEGYRYYVEISSDGRSWVRVIDRSREGRDAPHDYEQLASPVMARYVRITNVYMPAHGLFSLYDLRVFGSAMGKLPARVEGLVMKRDPADGRSARLQWKAAAGADLYIVRYGIRPDRLFGNYQVYGATSLDIHSLNAGVRYYFTVDAVNGTGIRTGNPF